MPNVRRQTHKLNTVVLGGQQPIGLNHLRSPFVTSVVIDIVSGTANYTVEFTTDDVTNLLGNSDPSDFRWLTLPNLAARQTETRQVTIEYPVTGIRLNIHSMTGEVRMSAIQGIFL